MDNQDKLFDKIKEASQNAEFKDFPGMEKVWSRVEEKLDKKEDKKTISLWKKVAIAASLLLLISLGSQFLQSDENAVNETPKVVLDEKENAKEPIIQKDEIIPHESEVVSGEEGVQILERQKERQKAVAVQETIVPKTTLAQPISAPKVSAEAVTAAPAQKDYISESNEMYSQEEKISGSLERNERESAKVAFAARETQKAKKPAPLVILNGNAMAHSDAAKRDRMMRSEVENVKPENMDSLLILDEPLYIIDGIYYSENDLFGNNPTSPYAPLDKQDIKTITILQDLEASSKYGEKGKKGVVIITTKNGKPAPKK